MILGLPNWLFMILAVTGATTTGMVILLVLFFLTPSNGKKLLSARLKKTGLLAVFGKASLRFVKVKSIAPGWVQTEEGKKYIWPIPPKEKSKSWNPVRDVISKVERIDNIPVLAVYEAECLATNADTLVTLEAYAKGYDKNELPLITNPGNPKNPRFKVYIPISPKILAETLRSMVTSEHIDVFEQWVIEAENKRRMKGEWSGIIKVGLIIGAIAIVAIFAMLLAKGAIFGA